MGPTWDPPGADRTQVGPMLATWTLLSGKAISFGYNGCVSNCQYRYGVFSSIGIPIIKIRWSHGHLIFIIGILILGKMVFILLEGHACYTVVSAKCTMYQWWCQQMEKFSRYWPFVRGIQLVTGGFRSQRLVMWSFDVFFDCWTDGWANNQDADDLKHHHAPYDVTVMCMKHAHGSCFVVGLSVVIDAVNRPSRLEMYWCCQL